jgi:hypothetical protein
MAVPGPCEPLAQQIDGLQSQRDELKAELPDAVPSRQREIQSQIDGIERKLTGLEDQLVHCIQTNTRLTGAWAADDGAIYFVRQWGEAISWVGLSDPTAFHPGVTFTNVFRGTLDSAAATINGDWIDLPRGGTLGGGALRLSVLEDSQHLTRVWETGGFLATFWIRAAYPDLPGIENRFDNTMRNDGSSMHDHLKMYKDYVVVFGTVCAPPEADPAFQIPDRQNYADFICASSRWWHSDDDPPDGDIGLDIQIDRADLDGQPGFWTEDWFNGASDIRDKLNDNSAGGDPDNPNGSCADGDFVDMIHCEAIMFGREASSDCSGANAATLLPGWLEDGANRLLFNSRPASVQQVPGLANDADHVLVTLDPTLALRRDDQIRVTGFLALDCHREGVEVDRDCEEGDPSHHNVELHPVYSIERIQDFSFRLAGAGLSGVWHCSDVGTYYVRQSRERVWWLGLSRDQGREFANVFQGTLQGDTLTGDVMDVPVSGDTPLSLAPLVLSCAGFGAEATGLTSVGPEWSGRSWRKLQDTPAFIVHPVPPTHRGPGHQ